VVIIPHDAVAFRGASTHLEVDPFALASMQPEDLEAAHSQCAFVLGGDGERVSVKNETTPERDLLLHSEYLRHLGVSINLSSPMLSPRTVCWSYAIRFSPQKRLFGERR